MKLPKAIVGIDPGTTAAVAVLSLKGKLLALESRKNFGRNEIIRFISSASSPTIVATDKALAPSLVMKVSSNFNSVVFSPKEDLKYREKLDLARGFKTKNSHQRDALAAAVLAYREHEDTLKKIEKTVEGLNLWKYADDIKDMILRGRCGNVAEAIDSVLSTTRAPRKKMGKKRGVTREEIESILGNMREVLKEKEKTVSILENYTRKLEERVKTLEEENAKLKKRKSRKKTEKTDHAAKNLKSRIKEKNEKIIMMNKRLNTLKELENVRKRGLVPVKVVRESSFEELAKTEKSMGLDKDVVYFRKYSKPDKKFIEKLKEKETEIVIGDFPESVREKLEKEGIMVIDRKETEIRIAGDCGSISPGEIKSLRKKGLIGWLKEYRKRYNE